MGLAGVVGYAVGGREQCAAWDMFGEGNMVDSRREGMAVRPRTKRRDTEDLSCSSRTVVTRRDAGVFGVVGGWPELIVRPHCKVLRQQGRNVSDAYEDSERAGALEIFFDVPPACILSEQDLRPSEDATCIAGDWLEDSGTLDVESNEAGDDRATCVLCTCIKH